MASACFYLRLETRMFEDVAVSLSENNQVLDKATRRNGQILCATHGKVIQSEDFQSQHHPRVRILIRRTPQNPHDVLTMQPCRRRIPAELRCFLRTPAEPHDSVILGFLGPSETS